MPQPEEATVAMTEPLSQDELTVLLIAARGEPMIPIGRWKAPTESLLQRGYLQSRPHAGDPTGYFNNYITPEGRKAAERDEDQHLVDILNASGAIQHAQQKLRGDAEAIAVQLVDLAQASSKVTRDSAQESLKKWSVGIFARATEMLNGR